MVRRKKTSRAGDRVASRYELLYQISDAMISTLEPRAVLDLILREAVDLLGASAGSVILMDRFEPDVLNIEVSYNLDPDVVAKTRLRLGQGVTGCVAGSGEPLVVPDVTRERIYVTIDDRIHSEIAVPLKLADKVIGVISLDSNRPNAFTEEDLEILVPLANHAAKVIQNAQLYDTTRKNAEALKFLQSISQSINSSLHIDEVLQRVVRGAVALLEARLGSIFLLDESGRMLHLESSYGNEERYINRPDLKVDESLLGQAVLSRHPLMLEDVQKAPQFCQPELARQLGLHGLIAAPLVISNEAIGVIACYFSEVRMRERSEIRLLTALANQSTIAIQNARLHERVYHMEEQIHRLDKISVAGETAAGLAHEIRNPLAVMNMLVSSLEQEFEQEDPRREDARVIRENIEHIHRLVENLLDVARLRPPLPQPVDLRNTIQSALNFLDLKFSRHQIKIIRRFEADLPLANVDPGRILQVLINLLQNAIEAIGSRGEIEISLSRAEEKDRLALCIHDDGPGIKSEAYKRLFEPFNTTKESGVGLGLSIVKRIVEDHHGTISVRTSTQQGTTFTLLLPVAAGESA
jgi:signal transduction histidine kinase